MTSNHQISGKILDTEVKIRRSSSARRMSLRISSIDRGVTLTVPNFVSAKAANDFIAEKQPWIEHHLNGLPQRISVSKADNLPFQGQNWDLVLTPDKSIRLNPATGQMFVPQDPIRRNSALVAFYKLAARDRLVEASDRYSDLLGVSYSRITLRDTRSRWGSCSSAHGLMYSWRLILAPIRILDYVAAHEVSHLVHMHHGPEFWETVKKICPEMEIHRRWLKENGVGLHQWDFTN